MCSDTQKSRLAPARRLARGAFMNRFLGDQLMDQHAHHSADQVHPARQVSTRNSLMLPAQIESDVPVKIARGGARGNVETPGIDFTHQSVTWYCLSCEQYPWIKDLSRQFF